jgi:hypothetical protein
MSSNFRKYLNKYEFKTVLPGSGEEITFRPITTGQMKSLLIHEKEIEMAKIEEILDSLLSECVVKPEDFDITSLYVHDRFYFLIELRKYTRGTIYEFEHICPDCGSQSVQGVDLKTLKIEKLPKNLKKVVKIDDNISVRLDFPKRSDQKLAYDILTEAPDINDMQRTAELGTIVSALTIKSIITPEGEDKEVPLDERIFFVESLSTQMYEKIADFSSKNFGIDFTTEINCKNKKCKYKKVIDIPPENFFF